MTLSHGTALRLRVAGLLGAAALLVAVWLGFGRLGRLPTPTPVRCITPSEIAAGSRLLLAWEGGGPPFRVTLEDAAGGRLWESGRLTEPLAAVPPAVAATLPPNQPLRWRVEGVDRLGRAFTAPACPLTLVARG